MSNYLVAGPGIEPGTGAYETPVLPLHYPAIDIILIPVALLVAKKRYPHQAQFRCGRLVPTLYH